MLSGTLLYILPKGYVKVGRTEQPFSHGQQEILLQGPLVALDHWYAC